MSLDLDGLARLAWAQVWQVTAVAILVGASVRIGCRERPQLAYVLWMLVVVKSIVPPVWSSPTGLFSWALVSASVGTEVAGPRDLRIGPPGPVTTPMPEAGSAQPDRALRSGIVRNRERPWAHVRRAAVFVWLAGFVVCSGFVLGKQVVCERLIRGSRLLADERYRSTLAKLSRRLGVKRPVRLIVTSRPIGPAAFGLIRPSILLPGPLLSVMPREQVELVLAHELTHIRRGDVFASKLQLASQLIWWFNPLVWWANQQANGERERCCDEEVLSGVNCRPVIYARTLLSVLELKGRLWTLVSLPGMRSLEVTSLRLRSIMKSPDTDHRRASRISRLVFISGLALLIPGAGLSFPARSPSGAEACRSSSTSSQDANPGRETVQGTEETCSQ